MGNGRECGNDFGERRGGFKMGLSDLAFSVTPTGEELAVLHEDDRVARSRCYVTDRPREAHFLGNKVVGVITKTKLALGVFPPGIEHLPQ
jgi:hypothetical protein